MSTHEVQCAEASLAVLAATFSRFLWKGHVRMWVKLRSLQGCVCIAPRQIIIVYCTETDYMYRFHGCIAVE